MTATTLPETALVTGATAGIGAATAAALCEAGTRVLALGRRRERLDTLEQRYPDSLIPVELDLGARAQTHDALSQLAEAHPELDLLVANAGLALGRGAAQEAPFEDWERMVDVNVHGLMATVHAFLPKMVARGKGDIILVGSTAGEYPYPGGHVYGATKSFVRQLGSNLRADLLGAGVRVTVLEPGMTQTEFSEVRFKGDRQTAEAVYQGTRPLRAEDLAETIVWLASRPAHVSVTRLQMMPTDQAPGPLRIHRDE